MFMRFASPNERRTISREDLGFYNALVIAGVYEVTDKEIDVKAATSYITPLKRCIQEYPFLGVVVRDKHTEKPFYEKVSSIDVNNHISVIHNEDINTQTEIKSIEEFLLPVLDRPWPADIPPWRIVVLPLPPHDEQTTRVFIAFSFSHTLGDGLVGHAFHQTFLHALQERIVEEDSASLITPSTQQLPPPFDTPSRLPISWKFLLSPLLAVYLPKCLSALLGLRAAVTTIDAGTWTGSPMFFDPSTPNSSRIRLLEIESSLVQTALRASRAHGSKLTGLIHQMIVMALSRVLPDEKVTSYVSGTAVDLRRSVGIPRCAWGLYVSGHNQTHPRPSDLPEKGSPSTFSDEFWLSARSITEDLALCATRLQDQAIGLLRYAPSIRNWTAGKVGQQRDCSYEVSNLLAFDSAAQEGDKCKITKMIFATPANVVSGPLVFNIISVKDGNLVIAVNWQVGALGVPHEEEDDFVNAVCESIRADFEVSFEPSDGLPKSRNQGGTLFAQGQPKRGCGQLELLLSHIAPVDMSTY
ncbi:alcohol acetyltransferase-domain-containing protein [Aspergillus tetrazonus]